MSSRFLLSGAARDRRVHLMSFNLGPSPGAPSICMKRVFGIETEYGITVNGVETVDVVAESIELVRCYTEHGALMKWDYELEDPHLDARGFRAQILMQDADESAYYELDKNRPLSYEEIKSDLVLSNRARSPPLQKQHRFHRSQLRMP